MNFVTEVLCKAASCFAGILIASSSFSGYAFSQAAAEAAPGNGSLVVSIQGAEHDESVCREESSAAALTTQAAQGNAAPFQPLAVPCKKQELRATDARLSIWLPQSRCQLLGGAVLGPTRPGYGLRADGNGIRHMCCLCGAPRNAAENGTDNYTEENVTYVHPDSTPVS